MRLASTVGSVLGIILVLGLIFLLSRGKPKPQPKLKSQAPAVATTSAGVQDAFAYAKDLQSRLASEPKYAKVYLVPSAATANQKQGKVVVMGEVESEESLRTLQQSVLRAGVPVALEWQVSIAPVPSTPQ